ncbi:MAG: hypothetical protein ACFFFB_19510 [Candidatus Heimdallarchaeota archaeon]
MMNRRQIMIYILGILSICVSTTPFIQANSTFTFGIEPGTQIYEVKYYDELTWNNTVNASMSPSNWLGGEAYKVGAKGKLTIKDIAGTEFQTAVLFKLLVYSNETLSLFPIVSDYGFGNIYINQHYPDYYNVWLYGFYYWFFTTSEFKFRSTFTTERSIIMKDPRAFTQVLNDYNDYAATINQNATLQALNITFPILSGDDLVWQLVLSRFVMSSPVNDFLTELEESLDCTNVIVLGNTLILQKHGEKNYRVEVTYNGRGSLDTFIVKDTEGYAFYKITSFYPKIILYIILGILAISSVGIVVLVIIRKMRLYRNFREIV